MAAHKFIFLLVITSFLVTSCSDRQNIQNKIKKLEDKTATEISAEDAASLSALYQAYTVDNPDDHELNGRYLYRAAGLEIRQNNTAAAIGLLQKALKDHYESTNSGKNAALLGKIYRDQLKNEVIATTIYQSMEKTFPDDLKNEATLPSTIDPVFVRLDSLRQNIFNEETFGIDFQMANNYIAAVESVVMVYPKYPDASALLFKAGEVARSIQTYNKAVELLNWINEKYPESEENPQAMFLKAFTLDDGLKEYDKAKPVYEAFIAQYPDNPFADDAKFSLDNLGKDINELIESFPNQ